MVNTILQNQTTGTVQCFIANAKCGLRHYRLKLLFGQLGEDMLLIVGRVRAILFWDIPQGLPTCEVEPQAEATSPSLALFYGHLFRTERQECEQYVHRRLMCIPNVDVAKAVLEFDELSWRPRILE